MICGRGLVIINNMLYKIPFIVGNLAACFVPGHERRKLTRAYVNRVLFYPAIWLFVWRRFGVRPRTIKFVRQVTLGRVVFAVNDTYFVKIFRDVSNRRLRAHARLLDLVIGEFAGSGCAHIAIPPIVVARRAPMYACARVAGEHLRTFAPKKILANRAKIERQVADIIAVLQSIDVNKIPDKEIYLTAMQSRTVERPGAEKEVLAHFDLNRTNCLFDENMDICAVIDWDGLSIAKNPETDWSIFMKNWVDFIAHTERAAK